MEEIFFMFGIGAGEFIVILIVGLIVFGPEKLPELGKTLGKGLKEFRKAQAAFSATLNEVSLEDKKTVATEKKISVEKKSEEPPLEKDSSPANVTADDVINHANQNPFKEKNFDEKIFNSGTDSTVADDNKRDATETGNANSIGKQSEPAKN